MGDDNGRRRRRGGSGPGAEDWAETQRLHAAEMVELGMEPAVAGAEAARKVRLARLRVEWGREQLDKFFEMQERAGEAWDRRIDEHPGVDWESDDAPDLPDPPEEAVAQAIYAELMAALEEDRWPRHLHERGV